MATAKGTTNAKTTTKKAAAETKAAADQTTKAAEETLQAAAATMTEGFEKAFTDARSRMENLMGNFGDISSVGRENADAFVESGNILAKGMEALNAEIQSIAQRNFDGGMEAMKALSGVRSAKEYFEIQSDLAKSAWDNAVADTTKINEIVREYSKEAITPIQDRMTVAMDELRKVAA